MPLNFSTARFLKVEYMLHSWYKQKTVNVCELNDNLPTVGLSWPSSVNAKVVNICEKTRFNCSFNIMSLNCSDGM